MSWSLSTSRPHPTPCCVWIALLFFAILPLLQPGTAVAERPWKYRKGHLLIKPRAGADERKFFQAINLKGGKSVRKLERLGVHLIALTGTDTELATLHALRQNPLIEYAELDLLVEPVEWYPNDPYLANQWHLPRMGVPLAWDSAFGNDVTVAILDTGCDPDHPDLANKYVAGWNIYDNTADWADVYGHGTKVAGTVAAETNNALGVASVAGGARIMPVRISQPDGWAYLSTIAAGLRWAADNGADVANISYSVSGSYAVQDAAQYFRDRGGITVVSAGNSGTLEPDQAHGTMISVSATNSSDALTGWSSYGEYVDVSAPGENIYTTVNGGGYGGVSGTSFSSPATAGVVSLIKSANPGLTPSQVEQILFETAKDLGTPGYDIYYGHGRVDAAAAVAAALTARDEDLMPPQVAVISPAGGTVSGEVTVNVSAIDDTGVTEVRLMINDQLLAADNTGPYAFAWDTTQIPDGRTVLQALAYDESGNEGISNLVTVEVKNATGDHIPPEVMITTPTDNAAVSGTVRIKVTSGDNDRVAVNELYIDGKRAYQTIGTSYTYLWNTRKLAQGAHTVQAVCTDKSGNASSHTIMVTVSTLTKTKSRR